MSCRTGQHMQSPGAAVPKPGFAAEPEHACELETLPATLLQETQATKPVPALLSCIESNLLEISHPDAETGQGPAGGAGRGA